MANPNWIDTSDNWTTAADWSTGAVPGAPDDVTIAQGEPQVTSNVGTVASVAVTASGELEIDNAGALATTGDYTNQGTVGLDYLDGPGSVGGASLTIGGTLTNSGLGTLTIGSASGNLSTPDTVTAAAVVNVGLSSGVFLNGGSASATLNVAPAAGFGTAGVIDGIVSLSGFSLLQFGSGQLNSIASDGSLSLSGLNAFLGDAGATTSNSALALASNAGSLTLDNGASITTPGGLTNSGLIDLEHTSNLVAVPTLLDVNSAAGLGTAGVLTGSVTLGSLDGASILEFASGQITTIAADSSLSLSGSSAFVADAGATTSNSALTGLADNVGSLTLEGASVTTSGALTNGGSIVVESDGTLTIGAPAGFGTAGVLDGQVQLEGGGLLEFASGQITSIASDGSLSLDATSFLADAAATTSNSALSGLSDIAGSLTLNNGASVTTTGPLTISRTLTLQGGGTFTTAAALTNAASGAINLTGGGTATPATLIVDAPAGLGETAGVLDGLVTLNGNALIQFSSGQITTIAADGNLTLSGANNFIADAGATTSNSALVGLADNAGTLSLEDGASLTTSTALTNSGTVDLFQTSTLTTGALTNSGTVAFAGGTYTTTGPLTNTGSIGLNTNTALVENQPSSLIVHAAAAFGTAGVVQGQVDLEGDALIQFDSGQITTIAQGASLTLGDSTAYVADAGAATSNSALTGLADNAGTLTLENGTTIDTSDPLINAATGTIDLTNFFENASAPTLDINSAAGFGTAGVVDGQVEIGAITGGSDSTGALLEFASGQITTIADDGSLSLTGPNSFVADAGATTSNSALALADNAGSLSLTDASATTPSALNSTGTINLQGTNSTATLDVNAAAGLGTAGVLTGQVNLSGTSLLEFAGGQITTIAANSSLSLDGPNAFVADAGSTTSNSALTGLTSNYGTLSLANGATATVNDFYNFGDIFVDAPTGAGTDLTNIGGGPVKFVVFEFSPPTIPGGDFSGQSESEGADPSPPSLTNSGTLGFGNVELAGAETVQVDGSLANTGIIDLTGNAVTSSDAITLAIEAAAGLGTAGVLTGQVNLGGSALLEFSSGQITSIAAGSGLSISGANALVVDSGATTSDSALALTSNAGTLALSDGASQTVAAGTALTSTGTIYVDSASDPNSSGQGGSTLTISGTLASSGTIAFGLGADSGTAGGTTVNGAGTLALTGGTATINAGATVSVATITIGAPATLELDGGTTTSPIAFTPNAGGTLKIDAAVLPATGGAFANPISDFSAGDTIDLAGLVYAGNPVALYDGTTLSVTEGGVTDTLTVSATGLPLFTSSSDDNGGTDVTIVCFASGTRLRTTKGDVVVEALAVGDMVVTASGESRPIRWLGGRTIECRRHPRPDEVMPVRIAAHSFGTNKPLRDLYVSPGHAICVDVFGEVLIPAAALLNGTSIVQVEVERVTYWHVELDSHDVVLAENLPAESYLEMGNRGFFAGAAAIALHATPDGPVKTHADFCRPFHATGAIVDAARRATQAVSARSRRAA